MPDEPNSPDSGDARSSTGGPPATSGDASTPGDRSPDDWVPTGAPDATPQPPHGPTSWRQPDRATTTPPWQGPTRPDGHSGQGSRDLQGDPYGHAGPPPGSGYAPESGQGSYGQGYGGPYGHSPYGPGPYGHSAPGDAPYSQGPWGQGPSGHGGYGPPGSGQGSYGQGQGAYGQGAYGQGAYGQGAYGQGAYGQGPYARYPYATHDPAGQYSTQYGAQHQGPYGAYQPPPYMGPYGQPPRQRTPEERRKRTRRIVVAAAVLVVAVGAGIGIGAAIAPTNPTTVARALVSTSVSAATSAKTYHYSELSTTAGTADDITGVAAPDSGRQVITEKCESGTNVFDLRLVKGVVYFKGNSPAVVDQLGVATTAASADAGKWVKVTKGESPYKTMKDGITTKSNISQLSSIFLASTSNQHSTTTDILGGLNDKGKAVGTATLVIATSTKLPKSFTGGETLTVGRLQLKWKFTDFGKKVSVSAPSSTIAYSSLHATKPSTVCG